MEITYSKHGDYLLPNLLVPEENPNSLGRYRRLRLDHLKHHRRVLYTHLKATCKLNEHIADIDHQAFEMVCLLTSQMSQAEGITETLKASNQMEWIGATNNIRNRAEKIILKELVFR